MPIVQGPLGWAMVLLTTRLTPFFLLCPPLSTQVVPLRIRAAFVMAISLVLVPGAVSQGVSLPEHAPEALTILVAEGLLGAVLGAMTALLLTGMHLAGHLASRLSGLDFATVDDLHNRSELPLLASFLGWLGVAIILAAGAHRYFLQCALDSFAIYPLGEVQFTAEWLLEVQRMLSHSFGMGIRLAAPLALLLLISNVLVGLVSRVLPQLNMLACGLSLNVLVVMTGLLLSSGSVGWVFQQEIVGWVQTCREALIVDR